jgi:hypothetical protein
LEALPGMEYWKPFPDYGGDTLYPEKVRIKTRIVEDTLYPEKFVVACPCENKDNNL